MPPKDTAHNHLQRSQYVAEALGLSRELVNQLLPREMPEDSRLQYMLNETPDDEREKLIGEIVAKASPISAFRLVLGDILVYWNIPADILAYEIDVSTTSVNNWTNRTVYPNRHNIRNILGALKNRNVDYRARYTLARVWEICNAFYAMGPVEPSLTAEMEGPKLYGDARSRLASVASPSAVIRSDGRLDAQPNLIFDAVSDGEDLAGLPARQVALIDVLRDSLPGNAPSYIRPCLENYQGELRVRGVQPILGLLKDMAGIIEAAIGEDEGAWADAGIRKAFSNFFLNHDLFIDHFPLDPRREEIYGRTEVQEQIAFGEQLRSPFEDVREATASANGARLTTDEFLSVVEKMTEFARVVSHIPPGTPEYSTRHGQVRVSARKRLILSGIGFMEQASSLLSSIITITHSAEIRFLSAALNSAVRMLMSFVRE